MVGLSKKNNNKEKGNNSNSIGNIILCIKPLRKWLFSRRDTAEYLRMMEPRTRPEESMGRLWEKRIGICAVLLVAAVLMGVICYTAEPEEGILGSDGILTRPEKEGEIELTVSGESEEGEWEKEMTFSVSYRMFTEEEKDRLSSLVDEKARAALPGDNPSLDHIGEKVVFISEISGTGVKLSWKKDDTYIRDNGTLIRTHIPADGIDTEVMLTAEWKNFKQVYHYTLHLDGPELSATYLSEKEAKNRIRRSINNQSTESTIELPTEYGYREELPGRDYLPMILILALIPICPIVWHEQQKRAMTGREEQMLIDHPGFINKVMLLLGAGLTLRFTIERIAGEYEREREEGGEKHFVYEELCVTMQELRDGVSEAQAIESFGKRCRCMPYMRFASVITQNIRKGAEGILVILEKEATDSLVERKQSALRRGEVAGTKLLFPMIMMLGLVMGIIMVPAFMSM